MKSELYEKYLKEIRGKLQKELGIKNPMEVPKIKKITINAGIGSYLQKLGSKDASYVVECLSNIAGQKALLNKAKMSISNFKLREGMPVGVSVTLRNENAYNFLYKLINLVYPRVRDFRGVNRNVFDKDGNCSVGFKDHTVFMEIDKPENSNKTFGLQVSIVTSTKNEEHSRKLLEEFGFPFKKSVKLTK
jgi:large subunit ribosomal protein L5